MSAPSLLNRRTLLRWTFQGVALGAVATVAVFLFTLQPGTWARLLSLSR